MRRGLFFMQANLCKLWIDAILCRGVFILLQTAVSQRQVEHIWREITNSVIETLSELTTFP